MMRTILSRIEEDLRKALLAGARRGSEVEMTVEGQVINSGEELHDFLLVSVVFETPCQGKHQRRYKVPVVIGPLFEGSEHFEAEVAYTGTGTLIVEGGVVRTTDPNRYQEAIGGLASFLLRGCGASEKGRAERDRLAR